MAKTKKKNYVLVVLFVLLIGISVGYAAFAQVLTITGTANANGNFKLAFTNAEFTAKTGVDDETATATVSDNGDNLNITMDLAYPGAGATIKATITNNGSIAAKLKDIEFTGIKDSDISVSFTTPALDSEIAPNGTTDVLITVKWNNDSTAAKTLNFTASLIYEQSTENFVVNNNADAPQS